jgi:predicted O-methyltransferase YrrM
MQGSLSKHGVSTTMLFDPTPALNTKHRWSLCRSGSLNQQPGPAFLDEIGSRKPDRSLLWKEVKEIFKYFRKENEKLIRRSGVKLGGGGAYSLLYFLARKARPKNVLETGVAAGWSSKAILMALEFNKDGHLYSSDFPYKYAGSEAAIGLLVDNHLKYRWTLCTQGDQSCLPDFVRSVDSVDFFHYDSSKTYEGRDYAWNVVQKKLSPGAIVIFDDIKDNFHFRDLTLDLGVDFTVIKFEGKYVGLFCSGDNLSLQLGGTDQRVTATRYVDQTPSAADPLKYEC